MCFDFGIGEALAVGGALAGAGANAAAASSRNKAIERSAKSQYAATDAENKQLQAQSVQTKLERSRESQRLRALALVQAASRGVSTDSGSVQLWQQQALIDEASNRSTIDTNLKNSTDRNTSIYNANRDQLKAGAQNVALSAFTGALSGLSTGLSISKGVSEIGTTLSPTDTDPSSIIYPEDVGPIRPRGWGGP